MNAEVRHANLRFALLNVFFWMEMGAVSSFAANLLTAYHCSSAQIGMITAAGTLLAFLLEPPLASLADRSSRWNPAAILIVMSIAMASLAMLQLIPGLSATAISLLLLAALMLVNAALPMVNSLLYMAPVDAGEMNFGFGRAAGSLSFAILSLVLGKLISFWSVNSIPLAAVISASGMFLATLLILRYAPKDQREKGKKAASVGTYRQLFASHPKFLLFLIACTLVVLSHNAVVNFFIYVTRNVGGDDATMGAILSFQALVELPGMILAKRIIKKAGCASILILSLLAFTIKQFFYWQAKSIPQLYGATVLESLSLAFFLPATVEYASRLVERKDIVKAQTCFTTVQVLANVLGALMASLYSTLGVHDNLLLMTLISSIGLIMALFTIDWKIF